MYLFYFNEIIKKHDIDEDISLTCEQYTACECAYSISLQRNKTICYDIEDDFKTIKKIPCKKPQAA